MSQIKALLKQAREAVDNDNYETVMKLCKDILKIDRENYMAMVLLGKCFHKLGPAENSPKAFQKAIEWNPTNSLAWQGLVGYYESVDTEESRNKLLTIYESYIKLESNENKLVKCFKNILKSPHYNELYNNIFEACNRLEKSNQLEILKELLQSLETRNNLSRNLECLYKNCLGSIISLFPTTENNLKYIQFLNRKGHYAEAFDKAMQMIQSNDTSDEMMFEKYVCELFNKLFIEVMSQDMNKYIEQIDGVTKKLLEKDPNNCTASISFCIILYVKKEILKAKQQLLEVIGLNPKLIHPWLLLTDISIITHSLEEALINLQQSLKLLESIQDCTNITKKIKFQQSQVYSMSHDVENLHQSLAINTELENLPASNDNHHSIFNAYLNLKEYKKAVTYVSEMALLNKEKADLFQIRLLNKQEKYLDALQLFEKCDYSSDEWLIEKGLIYWNLEQYENSLDCFIKTTEQRTSNYLVYYYLARYYNKFNKLQDACRYCELAFQLNTRSADVGRELCNIYAKEKKWNQYLSILKCLAGNYVTKDNAWVWQYLGLYYLENDDFQNSRKYLQSALRFNTENGNLWESLGDSYMLRGAYTAAMKAYQMAYNLTRETYPLLQIANIKRILGYYDESKKDFENLLLSDNGLYVVPVFKGYAETCLCLAKKYQKEQRLGRARDYIQMSTSKITLAILEQNNLSCLWKILADCAFLVAKLPEKYSFLIIITKIFEEETVKDTYKSLEKERLFDFASRCYCKALNLSQHNSFDYHDLATCYLTYARNIELQKEQKEKFLHYALEAAKKSVQLNADEKLHWNLLGSIAMLKNQPDYTLAQHCFITAINLNRYDAVSWTNLGILYLNLGQIKMANKVFQNAQSSDPFYVNSWVGQAIIAEQMEHWDAMDLFRHSTEIGQHQQAIKSYAHWVCHTLINCSMDDKANKYAIYTLDAIPLACDSIKCYLERNETDATAWNMHGILCEHLGLKYAAKIAYKNAYIYTGQTEKDKARINYGRLLYQMNDVEKAIEILTEIGDHTFSSAVELALALYKGERHEDSYSTYEQTLSHLTNNGMDQSDILVALGSITYKFHDSEATKTLLFQSIQLKNRSPWCLYATLSYALLENDMNLAKLVMNELELLKVDMKGPGKNLSNYVWHYAILVFCFYTFKKDNEKTVLKLNKLIHECPNEPITWLIFSQIILVLKQDKCSRNFTKCAETSVILGRNDHKMAEVLHLPVLSLYAAKDFKKVLRIGQQVIHLYPYLIEFWKLLVALRKNNFDGIKNYSIKFNSISNNCIKQL